ncbi:MAG: CRISPR-associated endoribonuclease Cas6 [Lachnospiraceae bacterium]|nr:CRISPR-associated endoribonuclease Cas6 [Lachnospiraceae bacterium]
MEHVNKEYAAMLHESGLHPYSQCIIASNKENIWNVCTVNEEAYNNIIEPLCDDKFKDFYIEYDDFNVKILDKKLDVISKKEFMDKYYFEDSDRVIKLQFRTPSAFKRQGRYVFMPELELIYQSLMNKYDAASEDEELDSEELLDELVGHSNIIQYNLQSRYYSVGGVRIPSFTGEMTIKINGPQQMANFVNMLCRFGEYSGIGIKTAMGMGSIRIIERGKA